MPTNPTRTIDTGIIDIGIEREKRETAACGLATASPMHSRAALGHEAAKI